MRMKGCINIEEGKCKTPQAPTYILFTGYGPDNEKFMCGCCLVERNKKLSARLLSEHGDVGGLF